MSSKEANLFPSKTTLMPVSVRVQLPFLSRVSASEDSSASHVLAVSTALPDGASTSSSEYSVSVTATYFSGTSIVGAPESASARMGDSRFNGLTLGPNA